MVGDASISHTPFHAYPPLLAYFLCCIHPSICWKMSTFSFLPFLGTAWSDCAINKRCAQAIHNVQLPSFLLLFTPSFHQDAEKCSLWFNQYHPSNPPKREAIWNAICGSFPFELGDPRPLGSICPLGRGFFLLSLILVCWDALLPNFLILYFIVCIFIWCGRMDSDIRKWIYCWIRNFVQYFGTIIGHASFKPSSFSFLYSILYIHTSFYPRKP